MVVHEDYNEMHGQQYVKSAVYFHFIATLPVLATEETMMGFGETSHFGMGLHRRKSLKSTEL